MTRLLIAVACASLVAPVVTAVQQRPVFRSRTSFVAVDVSVRAGNRPVGGLTMADFVLLDNGVPQVVEIVDRAAVPIDLTLVVDVSGSTSGRLEQYRSSVREIAALLRSEDQLRVIGFSDQVVEVLQLQSTASPPPVDRLQTGRMTALNDALIAALVRAVALDRRHLIVAFTDGMDTFSVVDTAKVVEVARRADAVLHLAISNPSSGAGPPIPPGGIVSLPRVTVTNAQVGFRLKSMPSGCWRARRLRPAGSACRPALVERSSACLSAPSKTSDPATCCAIARQESRSRAGMTST